MFEKEALALHKKLKGKISIQPKKPIRSLKDLSLLYTPGVSAVSLDIAKNKTIYEYTMKGNCIGIVTDGSKVLGLGNIGPEAALPVMEGKAAIFKRFADIDAFPICLKTQKTEEIISIIRNISTSFGGINLEDIAAPRCFEVERTLQDLDIPVIHDDQHGTAIVILAGLINASRVTKKPFHDLKVVINGAGAAGNAIAHLLVCSDTSVNNCQAVRDVIVCDSRGILHNGRMDIDPYKKELVSLTNKENCKGTLADALVGADVFIGVSVANVLTREMIKRMNKNPIIFALANPTPEIMPDKAKSAGAVIIATGRSDFPNQINNALAYPGVFRGILDSGAKHITTSMKLNAAYALARIVKKPTKNTILPNIFEKKIVNSIADAIKKSYKEE